MGSYYHYRPIFSVVSVCHSVHRGYPCTGPHPSVQGSGTIHPVQGPSSDPSPPPTVPCTGHGHGHGHIQTFSYWTSLYTDPPKCLNLFTMKHRLYNQVQCLWNCMQNKLHCPFSEKFLEDLKSWSPQIVNNK